MPRIRQQLYQIRLNQSATPPLLIKGGQHKTTGRKILWKHVEDLHVEFRLKCQLNVPLNWFHALMWTALTGDLYPRRGYTTAKELFDRCQKEDWGSAQGFPQEVRGGRGVGLMETMRRMSEATYKLTTPGAWELINEGGTGLLEYAVIPTLLALDAVLIVFADNKKIKKVPSSPQEAAEIAHRLETAGGKVFGKYYINFRKMFGGIMNHQGTAVMASEHWKRAVGWEDDHGYHIGKLTASLQEGAIFNNALRAIADNAPGRTALYNVFYKAIPYLKDLPVTRAVAYWPPVKLRGTGKVYGEARGAGSPHIMTGDNAKFWFLWKFGEDHHPIFPGYDKWLMFFSKPEMFAQVVHGLHSFCVWATSLARGSKDWKGLTDENEQRTWGLQVARRLIWLVEEVGILRPQICGKPSPFYMMGVNAHTNLVETLFDVQQFVERYSHALGKLKGINPPERLLSTACGIIDWANPKEAEKIQTKVLNWIKNLKRIRGPGKEQTAAEYWAGEAAEMAGKGHYGGRQLVAPPLQLMPPEQDAHLTKRPAPKPVPSPDADDVQIDNDPPAKRQKVVQDVSMEGPHNRHPDRPLNEVAVPDVRHPVQHASRPREAPGMGPNADGRDSMAEQRHHSGNVQGANRQQDEKRETVGDENLTLAVVVAKTSQSKPRHRSRSPADKARDRSRSPGSLPARRPRSLSRVQRERARGARARIADHPQALEVGGQDMSTMVAGLVAKYASSLGANVRTTIVNKISQIAQKQQFAQDYEQTAQPRTVGAGGREASGFWIFGNVLDGRKYGIVRGFKGATPDQGPTFSVKVVGGENDGKYETISADKGVYRPWGPFPVMAFAAPATAHGKIPLLERARLENQKLALTRAVVEEMVRREVMSKENTYAQLGGYREGQVPQEQDIVSYAREICERFQDMSIDWNETDETLWMYLDMGTRFGDVDINYRGLVLRRMRLEALSVWSGEPAEPMVVDMDPHAGQVGMPPLEPIPVVEAQRLAALQQPGNPPEYIRRNIPLLDVTRNVPITMSPSDTSWYAKILGVGATTISVVVAMIILVLLLIFSR